MKRYNIPRICCNAEEMEQCDTGEWVWYEDAKKEKAVAVALAVVPTSIDHSRKLTGLIECNCAERAMGRMKEISMDSDATRKLERKITNSLWWICPAHGYKKL